MLPLDSLTKHFSSRASVCVCVCVHMSVSVCDYVYMCIYVSAYTVYVYLCICVCECVWVSVCMCVSECVGVCVQKQLAALELHLLRATADVNTHSKFRNMVKKYYYIKCYIFCTIPYNINY